MKGGGSKLSQSLLMLSDCINKMRGIRQLHFMRETWMGFNAAEPAEEDLLFDIIESPPSLPH